MFLVAGIFMAKILVITGSSRLYGNSYMLAEAFIKGVHRANVHDVKIYNTLWRKMQNENEEDKDFSSLIKWADTLVIITPLHWFSFSPQIKMLLDKICTLVKENSLSNIKEVFLIGYGDTKYQEAFNGLIETYENIARYQNWKNKGCFVVPNVWKKGDVKKYKVLDTVENIGKEF